jgi:hypothetical protein
MYSLQTANTCIAAMFMRLQAHSFYGALVVITRLSSNRVIVSFFQALSQRDHIYILIHWKQEIFA